jgi:uncharacterized protein YbjT (DUF2867 family)
MAQHHVFITGGTGYVGQRLIPELLQRGHQVTALVRKGSEHKLPSGCRPVPGEALDKASFAGHIKPADTFVQLVGVAHPSPAKAEEFRRVDLGSVRESVAAAAANGIQHFVYVSVAQPAPTMKVYQQVRAEGEKLIRATGMNATILRPWYILGPGHRWPYLILPGYWICELIPATRDGARRLGLVTLPQMIAALARAVDHAPTGVRVVEVPEIRLAQRQN